MFTNDTLKLLWITETVLSFKCMILPLSDYHIMVRSNMVLNREGWFPAVAHIKGIVYMSGGDFVHIFFYRGLIKNRGHMCQ